MKAPGSASMRGRRRASRTAGPASDPPSGRPLLCIGGIDPSGGAGLIADMRAARAEGCEAFAVVAALTAQSSGRVFAIRPVPRGWVRAQIAALEGDVARTGDAPFGAVKTGLIADRASIEDLSAWYQRARPGPLVVDPVLRAGDGTLMMERAALGALVRDLLPLARLITPNRLEAEYLSGTSIGGGQAERERAARRIAQRGPAAVLLKGGHFGGRGPVRDLLYDGKVMRWLPALPRQPGRWHGLGCHLAAGIAARLALGDTLWKAVSTARIHLARGMRRARVFPSGRKIPRWS